MDKVVQKLKARMTARGVEPKVQDEVEKAVSSFALYGFPESHAISFALLAYASCWLKVHRPQEFYTGLLNNQPMGFYSPATLVKDGKRRGVKFRPVCVVNSGVLCHIEADSSIRLGLNYARGLHRDRAAELVRQRELRPFTTLADLLTRVRLNKAERRVLAQIGAFNALGEHRRSALWEVESLFDENDLLSAPALQSHSASPLAPMEPLERMRADYDGTSLTIGPHPMQFVRDRIPHVTRAADLAKGQDGQQVVIAGAVICRQRPGTAKGNVFISLEDETGISNAMVRSDLFEKLRLTITHESFLEIHGRLQIQEGVISILAQDIQPLRGPAPIGVQSHDFR